MQDNLSEEIIEVVISEEAIKTRVKEMAEEISRDYEGLPVVLVGTLKGSVYFLTDLSRELKLFQEIDFIKASSYGMGSVSSQEVMIEFSPKEKLSGKHVLWIEDIIDTGSTAVHLQRHLQEQSPKSLKLVSLLNKPKRRIHHDVQIHYLGFTIPDKFVVGYGLDYAGKYRNLPYIGALQVT